MKVQTYYLSQLNQLEVKISIKRLIDQNKMLHQYYHPDIQSQLMFSCQLFTNGQGILPIRRTRFMKKLLYDQPIIFNYKYKDLTYNSFIAINIWSTGKAYDQQKPLGGTTVSLFNQNFILRSGKYHLMIWPDRLADTSLDSTTPGITIDKNIKQLNYITQKVELYEKNIKNIKIDNKSQQTLKLKLLYTYKLIPASFLEIQFPTFNYPVVFQDQQYSNKDSKYVNLKQQSFDQILLYSDPDYQKKMPNPQQQLFFYLIRQNQYQNPSQLRPTKQQYQQMENLSKKLLRTELKPNQKLLFYRYRYFSMSYSRFLINFLHSVQWNNQRQQEQAIVLLKKWNKIDKDDALHLLSSTFCANNLYNKQSSKPASSMKSIRRYSVQIINQSTNKQIQSILLQLVQALRYQALDESDLANMLIDRGLKDLQICTLLFWYLKAQKEYIPNKKQTQSQLLQQISQMFTRVYNRFESQLMSKNPEFYLGLQSQQIFVNQLKKIAKTIKSMKRDDQKQKQQLRKRIVQINWSSMPDLSFPLNVNQILKQPIKGQCTMFASAMLPLKLAFSGSQQSQQKKIQLIYKSGDDLRQDQLILQMFSLMDSLLKGVNQDYKLTPYKALACSKTQGFVQFVPKTTTIQSIPNQNLAVHLSKLAANPKNPIYLELLKKNGETQLTQKFINENNALVANIIMENYILSCAGYCAITYFFAIGDRHLQNLLINDTGKIFHIDFGFILGKDPKPYPPPIKLRSEMVEAMGGRDSENFKKFKSKCLQAYLYLRKYSKMITNLFELMIDGGIKDLTPYSLNGLYEKFCPNMNDEQAQKHFLLILQQSLNAVFASINDRFHIWAGYFK